MARLPWPLRPASTSRASPWITPGKHRGHRHGTVHHDPHEHARALPVQDKPEGTGCHIDDPSIACFRGDEHTRLLVLAALGCSIVPLPTMATMVWITIRYPMLVVSDYSAILMARFRWLFGRFVPEAYWYGLLWGLKNTTLSRTPVIFANRPTLLVLACVFSVLTSSLLVCWIKPWRTQAANMVDTTVTLLLLLCCTMVVGLVSLDGNEAEPLEEDGCDTS